MKKIGLALIAALLLVCLAFAGEYVTTPQYLVIGTPTSNKVEKINVDIQWGTPNRAVLTWRVMKQDLSGVFAEHRFTVINRVDDPVTISASCIAADVPWDACTGAGTCENDCDESTTDFDDFVAGYAATLNSRAEALMWQDAQDRYATQATP